MVSAFRSRPSSVLRNNALHVTADELDNKMKRNAFVMMDSTSEQSLSYTVAGIREGH